MKTLILTALLFLSTHANAYVETLLGAQVQPENIILQVYTGGCTSKRSFLVSTHRSRGTVELTFLRIVPDGCKGYFPNGTYLVYTRAELGIPRGQMIKIMNSFAF